MNPQDLGNMDGARNPAGGHSRWVRYAGWALFAVGVLVLALMLDVGRGGGAGGAGGGGSDLVPWVDGLTEGAQASRESEKPMLVYFTADWCGPCQQMKAEVYSQPNVAEAITANFVPVKVDMTTQRPGSEAMEAAGRYGVQAIPTLMVMEADGVVRASRVGGQAADDLLRWLAGAM